MPGVQLQRYEQILQRMIARVVTRAGLTDMNDSSVVKHILAACAREIDDSNYQLTRLQDLFSIDRAAGDDLDGRARDIQPSSLSRVLSQRAVGYLVFSRGSNTGATITIPVGTVAKTEDGVSVRTTQQGVITSSSAEQITGHGVGRDSNLVAAIAVEAGIAGNIASGTAVRFSSKPPGIDEVTNPASFVQGRDEESDDEFRARIKLFVASLAKSTVDALKFASIGVTEPTSGKQVIYAHVFEDPIQLGNVTVYIDDGAGTAATVVAVAPSGTGGSVNAPVANVQTYTAPNGQAPFLAEHVGRTVTIAGAANGGNNGTFTITEVLGTTQVKYTNASGVVETFGGGVTYALNGENVTLGLAGPPVNSAVGGEEFLFLAHAPVRIESTITLVSSTRGTLGLGSDYEINPASGLVYFLTPLAAAEVITATYSYYTGLVALVQKILDGDPDDRANYPGVRAAGTLVMVRTPVVVPQTIAATLTIARGFDFAVVSADVETTISNYINSLGISGDIIRSELIERIMSVAGVTDVNLTLPASNVVILDNQIPRVTSNDIDLT